MPPAPILLRESTDPKVFAEAVWGRVFNHRRDPLSSSRSPVGCCVARTVTDVVAAVQFAIERGCRVSVRSGGHSWAAWSVRHDALLIDLGGLDAVDDAATATPVQQQRFAYDKETEIVSCSPGATGWQLNEFLAQEARFFAGGHCPDVGLGGFLLQGGMGWNCKVRRHNSQAELAMCPC